MRNFNIYLKFILSIFLIILNCKTSVASVQNKSTLLQIEKFFKKLTTLEANFIQVSPSGNVSTGKIYLQLPGKLRIDYENPSNILITCKGFWIVIQDRHTKTTNNIPVKSSPLAILLENKLFLRNENFKIEYKVDAGVISLKIKNQNGKNKESLILEFSENPLSLKKWILQDALGENTTVLIQNAKYNNKLSHLLFFPDDFPDPNN